MNLIEPTVNLIEQEDGFEGMIKHVDYCAGICYGRNEPHETFDKQLQFVQNLIQKGHYRPLEFGTVYLKLSNDDISIVMHEENPLWTKIEDVDSYTFVVTNFRVITELYKIYGLFDNPFDFVKKYWVGKDEVLQWLPDRKTFKLNCSRAIADEARTHITLSSLMQSTRYCNFKNGINVIKPYWFDKSGEEQKQSYLISLNTAESTYMNLINNGLKPQEARGVLPLDMSTVLLLCGFVDQKDESGWNRFLDLRTDSSAHPDIQFIANKIKTILK